MKLALHWKILIGMILGLVFGYLMKNMELKEVVVDWVKPFGTIFINLLKMIAVPLIIVSLVVGLSDLKDISKLSKLGGRTVVLYLITTVTAVSIGLVLANLIRPGDYINEESRKSLLDGFAGDAAQKIELAEKAKNSGPLQPLVDVVPENLFLAMTDNSSMLQVILFVILMGIGLILIDENKAKPVVDFFKGLNDVILKIIDIIMMFSPIGVFALMTALMVEIPDFSTLNALLVYAFTVILGLLVMTFVVYPTLLITLAKYSPVKFFKAISPAQLLAFSTSSRRSLSRPMPRGGPPEFGRPRMSLYRGPPSLQLPNDGPDHITRGLPVHASDKSAIGFHVRGVSRTVTELAPALLQALLDGRRGSAAHDSGTRR